MSQDTRTEQTSTAKSNDATAPNSVRAGMRIKTRIRSGGNSKGGTYFGNNM